MSCCPWKTLRRRFCNLWNLNLGDAWHGSSLFVYCRRKSPEFLSRLGDKSFGNSLLKLRNHFQHESIHDILWYLATWFSCLQPAGEICILVWKPLRIALVATSLLEGTPLLDPVSNSAWHMTRNEKGSKCAKELGIGQHLWDTHNHIYIYTVIYMILYIYNTICTIICICIYIILYIYIWHKSITI